MNDKVFLDTNILIYCYSNSEPTKQKTAQKIANLPRVTISTQVLKELINTLSRKFKLDWNSITTAVEESERNFLIHTNTSTTIKQACQIADRYQFSFYDSLIVSAALESGAKVLYSEDMQHGQVIEGKLTITNPFI